ncbi:hypothetical protein K1X76_10165 [bacterium]|nr:hypothetical protein [bacterium]
MKKGNIMGGGAAYNEFYTQATKMQADANVHQSEIEADATKYAARQERLGAVEVAKYDYMARIAESKSYERTQMEALRVRELEAKLSHKEEMTRIFEVDVPRAEAAKMMGQAAIDKEENKRLKNEQDYDLDLRRYEDRQSSSYWTG